MDATLIFPLVIHKDRRSDYGVTVPDLPGCFSAGRTIEEAIHLAREAIVLHLDGLRQEGLLIPHPKPIATHRRIKDYARAVWAIVLVPAPKQKRAIQRSRSAA